MMTNETFLKRLSETGSLERVTPMEEYQGRDVKILFRCNTCGYEWKTRPDHITGGCGCPKCRDVANHKKYAKTHEQFIKELKEKGILDKIEVLGEYYANDSPIFVQCKECGYKWETIPARILSGSLCLKCAREKRKKTNIDFILELEGKRILDKIVPLEDYKGCKEKILFRCLRCGNEWLATPDNILQNKGCPNCQQSSLEYKVEDILKENNIEYIKQYYPNFLSNGKSHLSLDFYLPKYNIAIECQGKQHFYPIEYWGGERGLQERLIRDEKKYSLCKDNGINLLYYTECHVPKTFKHTYMNKDEIKEKLIQFKKE